MCHKKLYGGAEMALDGVSATKDAENKLVILDKKVNTAILKAVLKEMEINNQESGIFYPTVKVGSAKQAQFTTYTILATQSINTINNASNIETQFHRIDLQDASTLLGQGGQGRVVLARNLVTGNLAALKVHFQRSITFEEDLERERRNLKLAGKLIGQARVSLSLAPSTQTSEMKDVSSASSSKSNTTIQYPTQEYEITLMEYCSGANLLDFMYEIDNTKDKDSPEYFIKKKALTLKEKANLVLQVLQQVNWLHQTATLLHKDLKSENFVLRGARFPLFQLRLIDLGSGLLYKGLNHPENEKDNSKPGNIGHIAPEMLVNTKDCPPFDMACEFWSLGVVIAEIISDGNYQKAIRKVLLEALDKDSLMDLNYDRDFIYKALPDVICDDTKNKKYQDPQENILWAELTSMVSLLLNTREIRATLDLSKFIDKLLQIFFKKTELQPEYRSSLSLRELRKYSLRLLSTSNASASVATVQVEDLSEKASKRKELKRSHSSKKLLTKSKVDISKTSKDTIEASSSSSEQPASLRSRSKSASENNHSKKVIAKKVDASENSTQPRLIVSSLSDIHYYPSGSSSVDDVGTSLEALDLNETESQTSSNPVVDKLLAQLATKLSQTANTSASPVAQVRRSLLIQQTEMAKRSSGNFEDLRADIEMLSDISKGTPEAESIGTVYSTLFPSSK